MSSRPLRFRVLTGHRLVRLEGAAQHFEAVYEEVTQEQAMRYSAGDPNWRDAGKPQPLSLLGWFHGWLDR